MARYQGGILNDTRIGNGEADEFFGSWGDDTLVGEGGDDFLDGQEGNDTLAGGAGNDKLRGNSGNDTLSGGDNADDLNGGDGNDTLNGDAGDDDLNGGDGNDFINGGTGHDKIHGGFGDDVLRGESGNDTIFALSGADRVDGGSGDDTIHVEGGSSSRYHQIFGGIGNDTIYVDDEKVKVDAGEGNDAIRADLDFEQYLIGGNGADRFVITGIDPFSASSGRLPYIDGGIAGLTTVDGGLFGGSETVTQILRGADTSVDTLDLSGLGTAVSVDLGISAFLGVASQVDIEGNIVSATQRATIAGIENVDGTNFNDKLDGNDVRNVLRGGDGKDTINGFGGDDTLFGGNGADILLGGAGSDRIIGDFLGDTQSADKLNGGAGADTFIFVNAAKTLQTIAVTTPNGAPGGTLVQEVSVMDTISDFDTTGDDHDTLDLSILFDIKSRTFTGSAQDAITQGFLRFVQVGGTTQVIYDTNGGTHTDTANNFTIVELAGVAAGDLRADHFLI
jgi:Ca2+-binding RTX toxin-like protein